MDLETYEGWEGAIIDTTSTGGGAGGVKQHRESKQYRKRQSEKTQLFCSGLTN